MTRFLPTAAILALLAACSSEPAANTAAAPAAAANMVQPAPGSLPGTAAPDAAAFLPAPGTHAARAVAVAPSPELNALGQRIMAAIQRNPEWYTTYAAQYPGGHLPYHPNLGVSAAEYARFVELTRHIGLRELGPVTLTVTARPDGGLALAATGQAAALDNVVLYPARNMVQTPLGPLANRIQTGQTNAAAPAGLWQGVQWNNRGADAAQPVKLSLGRRAAGDMILLYDYGPQDAQTVVLLYPAPAGAAPVAR